MADTQAAMLYASGNAMLNGAGVSRSTAIFAGDKIQTAQDATARLNVNGSTVLVPGNSSVQFNGNGIDLQSGSAVISTSKGLNAHVGEVTVAPKNGSAKFEVSKSGENVLIAANSGSLSLTDANGTTTLEEGKTTTVKASKAGAAPAAGSSALGTIGAKTAVAVGVGLAVAATAAAIAVTSSDSQPAVSPARP
jgi:hypothetical protein